ncbi:hypothetical protein COU57_00630 [Candidatus Pacearchaeota archaeon CG10_big_fil_rev_8_21_14_0_10_32_14]|nr:MAG: hypothetical protein COU57_00630 [Candidatus Pacearchaeota archaeon CG10_big_fil_rev_8_21_14_0_10_32_14]
MDIRDYEGLEKVSNYFTGASVATGLYGCFNDNIMATALGFVGVVSFMACSDYLEDKKFKIKWDDRVSRIRTSKLESQ